MKTRWVGGCIVLIILVLLLVPLISADFFSSMWEKITGKATSQTVVVNISIGVPQIIRVYNSSISVVNGPNEYPVVTPVVFNFSVYNPIGSGMINHSSASGNISFPGQTTRQNSSCARIAVNGDYANYTCNITMWWWDGTGAWNITAYIEDNNTNSAQNYSTNFYVGERTAFVLSPSSLNWPGIGSGSRNQTSNNDPLLLNNTGNDIITLGNIQVNATNLRGETTSAQGLWAGNFSVNWSTGGTPPLECGGTTMNKSFFTGVTGANLSAGNFTVNDGEIGQEQMYFCLKYAGAELSSQPYSTYLEGSWTIKIV